MKRQVNIPLVQQDLSHEETVLQISLSLEKLQNVVSSIFKNVNCTVEKQKHQLSDIQERSTLARQKVEKLIGIDKSVQVFSSSKFPGPTPPTFYPLSELIEGEPKRDIRIPFTPLPHDKLCMNEKLKFYHIKDSTLQLRKNECLTPSEGLGEVPDGIKTVNSLLLYNTKQNLFAEYKILDPLTPPQKHVVVDTKDTRPSIGPAPLSLAALENHPNLQNYFYSPSIQDVPDIKAPLNLPNLTGIAGDLQYGDTADDQIDFTGKGTQKMWTQDSTAEDIVPIIDGGDSIVNPVVSIEENKTKPANRDISKKLESPAVISPPPPPPPPPPLPPPDLGDLPTPPVPKPRTEISKPEHSKPPSAPSIDSRADLMAAIRKAGGSGKAKLKPVSHDLEEAPSVGTSQTKPGNFMDDLHAKLSMRRKGISGKLDNSEGAGIGMLDRINSMIPPPPPKDSDSCADEGSDWEE